MTDKKMGKHTVSVLITYYNEKELLTECLDSLFSELVKPDEVIIYDDFSEFPASDYVQKEYNIKIIRGKENRGPGYGRNQLFKETRCDYINFHDADDLFTPKWCEKVKEAIETTRADIILTEASSIENGRLVSYQLLKLEDLARGMDPVRFAISRSILTGTTTINKETMAKIGGFHTREILPQSEDYDFHIRALANSATHAKILEPLLIQRIRSQSHSSKDMVLAWSSAIDAIRLLSEELGREYRQDLAEAAAKIGSRLFSLKAYDEADKAFSLAYNLGLPKFVYRSRLFYLIAKILGPRLTERAGAKYRKFIPEYLRRRLR